jgi:hypothetical protein
VYRLQVTALVAGVAIAVVPNCSSPSDDGWVVRPAAPEVLEPPPGHFRSVIPGMLELQAVKWLLLVRREESTGIYDDTIRRIIVIACGRYDYDEIKGLRIEDIYQVDKINAKSVIGCGLVHNSNHERYYGKLFVP